MITVVFILGIVIICLALGVVIGGWFTGSGTGEWARTNGIVLSAATTPVVDVYLRNRRSLRRVGAFGGLVIPPAFTAATAVDLHVPGIVWVLLGYLVGQLIAELTLARVPSGSPRAASLSTRRLGDYLPRTLWWVQLALPGLSCAIGVAVVLIATDGPGSGSAMSYGEVLPGALAAGPIALAVGLVSILGERSLVRRPQPIVEPDLIALDDAMRSSSVRTVAATSVAIAAMLIATQLMAIAYSLDESTAQGALWTAAALVVLVAFWSWRWWVERGWRVRRPETSLHPGAAA